MPANVSPDFKKAEAEFRQARDTPERLRCLKEMLRTIPKHKGTERLQADIKTRIRQLTDELSGPRAGAVHGGPPQAVRQEGAAQIAIIGPPNAGKSSLHVQLTGSHSEIGPYPFTTRAPVPGMLAYEDVHFQLVDLPPISRQAMESWYINALQPADAAILVIDLGDCECLDHVTDIRDRLDQRRVSLVPDWPCPPDDRRPAPGPVEPRPASSPAADDNDPLSDPFRLFLPTLMLANKSDLLAEPDAELATLQELLATSYPASAVSARTGRGLAALAPFLFRALGIVRVYTKTPGREADLQKPYTLRRGSTVHEVARLIHKEIARDLKFARVWGSGQFPGQQVGPEHQVADRDILEVHV